MSALPDLISARNRPVWSFAICGAVLMALLIPLPKTGRAVNALFDCAHAPAFALLSYLLFRSFSARSSQRFSLHIWLILAALVLLGIGTELGQRWFGRTASSQDAISNVLGAVAGAIWFHQDRMAHFRFGHRLAAMLIAVSWLLPGIVLVDVFRQRQNMPVIATFDDSLEMTRWSRQNCEWARTAKHVSHGRFALHVELQPATYPGITFHSPVSDWSGYETLVFDAFVEGDTPLILVLKIQDASHDGAVHDRYNGRIALAPGPTAVRVPISEISAAPQDRQMDLTQVAKLQLFAVRLSNQKSFSIDHLRLE